VFVVEGEVMIRMMVVDMLEELGHTVSAEAGRLDQACSLRSRPTLILPSWM
jgi:hypothetical protein